MGMIWLSICLTLVAVCLATIERPMGVAISMASLYRPGVTFRCLDGSKEVPWDHVNDDYCDCADGSDEPGTSACPNGNFHCTNAGYRPMNIQSSRVNDRICDCCDGTDEYDGKITCVNNCKELGRQMREERDKVKLLQEQGYKTKLTYIEEGKKKREEKKADLEHLEKEKAELEAVKVEMEAKKNEAEGPENAAKEAHKNAWDEQQEKRKAEKDHMRALIVFGELDTNNDKRIDVHEIKAQGQFDIDSNGEVSDEEAKEHLEDVEFAEFEHFLEKVWPHIKEFYKSPGSEEDSKGDNNDKTGETEPVKPPTRSSRRKRRNDSPVINVPDDGDEDYDYHGDDEEDDEEEADDMRDRPPSKDGDLGVEPLQPPTVNENNRNKFPRRRKKHFNPREGVPNYVMSEEEENNTGDKKEEDDEEKMPDYDDATKALIAAADEARNQFNDAEGKLKDTDNKIRDIKAYLDLDYGPEEEFSALKGNCYEYTDREYTYKLCAFDRASQRPKHGGSETTLGNWGHWEGPADDKYSAQKYENGQNCWNGPNRSVKVNLKCGTENQLTNAFEPNRCVYEFDFLTPSRCSHALLPGEEDIHDEL